MEVPIRQARAQLGPDLVGSRCAPPANPTFAPTPIAACLCTFANNVYQKKFLIRISIQCVVSIVINPSGRPWKLITQQKFSKRFLTLIGLESISVSAVAAVCGFIIRSVRAEKPRASSSPWQRNNSSTARAR